MIGMRRQLHIILTTLILVLASVTATHALIPHDHHEATLHYDTVGQAFHADETKLPAFLTLLSLIFLAERLREGLRLVAVRISLPRLIHGLVRRIRPVRNYLVDAFRRGILHSKLCG